MTENEIKAGVINLISELLAEKGFDVDIIEYIDLIDDAGMDSITFISIVVEIEAIFDIVVPDEMLLMDNFRNTVDIVALVVTEKQKSESNGKEEDGNG